MSRRRAAIDALLPESPWLCRWQSGLHARASKDQPLEITLIAVEPLSRPQEPDTKSHRRVRITRNSNPAAPRILQRKEIENVQINCPRWDAKKIGRGSFINKWNLNLRHEAMVIKLGIGQCRRLAKDVCTRNLTCHYHVTTPSPAPLVFVIFTVDRTPSALPRAQSFSFEKEAHSKQHIFNATHAPMCAREIVVTSLDWTFVSVDALQSVLLLVYSVSSKKKTCLFRQQRKYMLCFS